jgi:hypothetical protein
MTKGRRVRRIHRFPDFDKLVWKRLFSVTSQRVFFPAGQKSRVHGPEG